MEVEVSVVDVLLTGGRAGQLIGSLAVVVGLVLAGLRLNREGLLKTRRDLWDFLLANPARLACIPVFGYFVWVLILADNHLPSKGELAFINYATSMAWFWLGLTPVTLPRRLRRDPTIPGFDVGELVAVTSRLRALATSALHKGTLVRPERVLEVLEGAPLRELEDLRHRAREN